MVLFIVQIWLYLIHYGDIFGIHKWHKKEVCASAE